MQHFLRSGLLVVNVALLAVVATGCATVIPPSNLLPASYQVQHKHSATVTVKVMSGQVEAETYAHFTGDGFAEALAQAIRKSGVFAQAQTSGGGTISWKDRLTSNTRASARALRTIFAAIGS